MAAQIFFAAIFYILILPKRSFNKPF